MSEQQSRSHSARFRISLDRPRPRRLWRDLTLLVLLILTATGLRAWQLSHTEVAARDSIGFIREAWRLREQPWGDVLRTSEQHPGYPMMLLALSLPVRHLMTGSDAFVMQLSAQLTSALAGILLIFPMYYFGKVLFNRRVAFWATLFFQLLPSSSRILADGLSEATFLLFAGTSLLLAALALRRRSNVLFALTGLTSGLAYLTRPEGAVIVAAAGGVLMGMQVRRTSRWPWGRFLVCGFSMVLGWALVSGPFMATTRHFTTKGTPIQIGQPRFVSVNPMPPDQKEGQAKRVDPGTPDQAAQPEVAKVPSWSQRVWESPMVWGLRKLWSELQKGFFYVTWFPALLGLWWHRARISRSPSQWVMLLVCSILLPVLYRVASYMHYLSDRHAILLLYCCSFWTAAGFLALGRVMASFARIWLAQTGKGAGLAWSHRLVHDPRFWTGLTIIPLTAVMLVKDMEPLHANRKGFKDAGAWIAENAAPSDEVIDPYCWTHYYAGRIFREDDPFGVAPQPARVRYIIVDESGNEHPRLRIDPEIICAARQGRKAYEAKMRRNKDYCDVCVYAVPVDP